jgi:indolepyruvate ferredoxin oxidoreductase
VLVIEEKAPVVERQIKELLYHLPDFQRPRVVGKTDEHGAPVLSALASCARRIMGTVADWLARLNPALDRRHLVVDFLTPCLLQRGRRRAPPALFLLGLPAQHQHQAARGLARAGRHRLPLHGQLDGARHLGLIQMGGEGVDWAAHAASPREARLPEPGRRHLLPLGLLAIRQAIAARANITYKILYNDAVAMTGGQPVDGRPACRRSRARWRPRA